MEDETLTSDPQLTAETETENGNVTVNVYVPETVSASADAPDLEEQSEDSTSYSVSTYSTLDEPSSSEGASMSALMETIFGAYSPRTQTVTTIASDGSTVTSTEIVPGLAGLDYTWLSGVLTFSIVLYGLLSMIRVVLRHD